MPHPSLARQVAGRRVVAIAFRLVLSLAAATRPRKTSLVLKNLRGLDYSRAPLSAFSSFQYFSGSLIKIGSRFICNYCKEIGRLFHKRASIRGHRKLPVLAIVTAAMRKLLHLICGVLKNQLPFDPNYGKQFAFYP
jgi:hypothetical protein